MEEITINIPVTFEKNYEVKNPVSVSPLEIWRKELAFSVHNYVRAELERLYASRERVIDITEVTEGCCEITYASKEGRTFTYNANMQKDEEYVCTLLMGDEHISVNEFTHSQIDLMLRAAVYNAHLYYGLVGFPQGSYAKYYFEDAINCLINYK